jgi:tripartite-type tricarboxylate transporter receptor subunit TctC
MLGRTLGRALALALICLSAPVVAQPYPNRPIRIILPVPPGSLTDVIARRIAADASALMGQTWIMDNRPGANFIPAAEACRHATADGYTLCVFTTSTVTFNPHLIDKLPYNAEKDFIPIINLGMLTGGLVASPKLGLKTIEELRALAIAKPGTLNFGTYGPASSANVFRHYLEDRWKTRIVEVPYKGANELVAALVSGEIQMTWTALGNWADNPNDAKGTIMTLDALKRSPKIPNVPTYADAGLGEYPIHTWMALFAPAGVPEAIITQVNKAVAEAMNKPALSAFLVDQLIEPMITSAPDFAAYVARERQQTGEILHKFNIPKIQ